MSINLVIARWIYFFKGMILVGIFFQNVPVMSVVGKNIDRNTSSILRSVAFCVILCKAGLRLKIKHLKLMKWNILKLSILPSSIEMLAITFSSYLILQTPLIWSFMLGYVKSRDFLIRFYLKLIFTWKVYHMRY